MKFNLEHSPGNMIHSYAAGEITVQLSHSEPSAQTKKPELRRISASMILTPTLLIVDWIDPDAAFDHAHLVKILETKPEIILLGTGAQIQFPDPALLAQCQQSGVGMEVLDTGATCRTYNVLASEGRKVCAAFMRV